MRSGSSLEIQHGGMHYKGRAIQPVEFWAANRWDGFACSILKYVTRWRDKNGVEDLNKAMHFAQMRCELHAGFEVRRLIKMSDYVRANFPDWNEYWRESAALTALELWVLAGEDGNNAEQLCYKMFVNNMQNLIDWAKSYEP